MTAGDGTPLSGRVRWAAAVVVGLAVALRLLTALTAFSNDPERLVIDEGYYIELADNLRTEGELFRMRGGDVLRSDRTPAYPVFLAGARSVFGESIHAVRILQCLLGGLSVWLTFMLARTHMSGRRALIAMAVPAFYPLYIIRAGLILNTNIYVPLILVFFLLIHQLKSKPTLRTALAAGIVAGAATLTRPEFLLFPAVLGILACVRSGDRRALLAPALALAAGMAALVAPWLVRNAIIHDGAFVMQSNQGQHLWTGNYPGAPGDATSYIIGSADEESVAILMAGVASAPPGELERDEHLRALAVDAIRERPIAFATRGFRKLGYLWNIDIRDLIFWGQSMKTMGHPLPAAALMSALLLLGISSFVLILLFALALPQVDLRGPPGMYMLLVAYTCALIFVFVGHVQYHIALAPFLGMVIAKWSPSETFKPQTAGRRRRSALSVLLAIAFVANVLLINEWDLIAELL